MDRETRRKSFDRVAAKYDVARPHYPTLLFDEVIGYGSLSPCSRALEIGSGTGIATLPFAERLGLIVGLEPGENLCAFARKKLEPFPQVRIENASFEDFEIPSEKFDLVFSAQAFHWIPVEIAYLRSHHFLVPGGTLALFWNMSDRQTWDKPLCEELDEVYAKFFPKDLSSYGRLPKSASFEAIVEERSEQIQASGLFKNLELKIFPWEKVFRTPEYLELLDTYSENLALEESTREKFYEEVAEVLARFGSSIRIPYQAVLYLAKAA